MEPEVDAIVKRDVLRAIKGPEVAALASALIRFKTVNPPGDERPVSKFMRSWFRKRGIVANLREEVPGRTNLEATVEGGRPGGRTLVLNGHTDVVPKGNGWTRDPFGGEIAAGRVYGRGSVDMKGALASMMVAMEALNANRPRFAGRVVLNAVADEEAGSPIGTGYMIRRGLKGDFAVVGEPTALEVCVCHKGVIRFDVEILGRAAHAGLPEKGVSAILGMNEIMTALKSYAGRLSREKRHGLLGPPTVNIGTIEGGVKVNIVPDRCKITVDRRVVPPESVDGAVREARSVVEEAARKYGIRYKLVFTSESQPSEAAETGGYIEQMLAAASLVTGRPKTRRGFAATCDARYLNNDARIPTVILGPGRLEDAHRPDESVRTRELEQAAKIYALMLLRLQL